MVSHELKTPLTSLTAYVQLLHARAKREESNDRIQMLGKASQQISRMSSLINDFLNVSRFESGRIHVNKEVFDLKELITQIVSDTSIMFSGHNIAFVPCGAVPVEADPVKIGSVLSNLLINAAKYSPRGKNIEVKCETLDDLVQISVRDEGFGIKAQDLEKLFERYYRVDDNRYISGFGIGLYLAAEIISRHEGKIWAESRVGEGSTFYFSLPLSRKF
jgi:two-component system, OmpR family, sensor histidine kinase VicK